MIAHKISNFENLLPATQSELATQTMKDPYVFDFIPFKEDMVERDIENALVREVTSLLLELGTGFAFLGNQYHLTVGGDDFYSEYKFGSTLPEELSKQLPSVEDIQKRIK